MTFAKGTDILMKRTMMHGIVVDMSMKVWFLRDRLIISKNIYLFLTKQSKLKGLPKYQIRYTWMTSWSLYTVTLKPCNVALTSCYGNDLLWLSKPHKIPTSTPIYYIWIKTFFSTLAHNSENKITPINALKHTKENTKKFVFYAGDRPV